MPTKPSVWAVKSPKIAPTLELTQKFVTPLMLLPAGRLAALKKLGLPQLRIRQEKHRVRVNIRFRDGLVGHYLAFERSKSDVVHDRDVVRERRIEDVDGGLLISEEAVDLRLGEAVWTVVEVVVEVVVDGDLHGVFSAPS